MADRAAARAKLYGLVVASAASMGVAPLSADHFQGQLKIAQAAERLARSRAAQIRRGER